MMAVGEQALRAALERAVCHHLGIDADADFYWRPVGLDGMISMPVAAALRTVDAADLRDCLLKHRDEALKLIFARLDLDRYLSVAHADVDGADGAAALLRDDTAPDGFADRVVLHRFSPHQPTPRTGAEIVPAVKHPARAFPLATEVGR